MEKAKPIVTYVMETLATGQNIIDPKVKNQIAAQVLPLIEDLPNALERDTYRQQLARMLRVDESALTGTHPQASRVKRPRVGQSTQKAEKQAAEKPKDALTLSSNNRVEAYIIGVLVKKPELLYRLDRTLQEYGLCRLPCKRCCRSWIPRRKSSSAWKRSCSRSCCAA
jgi:DNA primase